MKDFTYVNYEGKRILVAKMSIHEAKAMVEALDELAELVSKEPEKSVRVLVDVSDGRIFEEATARAKEKLAIFDRHILRGAVVGPAWMRLITSVVLVAARFAQLDFARRVKAFATGAEAMDYLVQEGGE